jgi:hypothetical protein
MNDIKKCIGTDCPIKEQCYRFTAIPNSHQSYFVGIPGGYEPIIPSGSRWKCDMYWGFASQQIIDQFIEIVEGKKNEKL